MKQAHFHSVSAMPTMQPMFEGQDLIAEQDSEITHGIVPDIVIVCTCMWCSGWAKPS